MTFLKISSLIILILISISIFSCTRSKNSSATLAIINARIWTGDSSNPWAEAISIQNDTITAVGDNSTIENFISEKTKVIDAQGQFVCPGFTDSHVHFLEGGMRLASVNLRNAQTPEEFTKKIKNYADTLKPGTWILGGDWDHTNWGGKLPEKSWIDSVTPENPVWVSRLDGHMALANSKTLDLAGIDNSVKDTAGGTFIRDGKGNLTGILKDNAMEKVESIIPEPGEDLKMKALNAAMDHVHSMGVTSVHHMGSWDDLKIFEKARAKDSLKVRIYAAVPIHTVDRLARKLKEQEQEDKWLKIGGLKGFIDGSLGSHTAAMFEPYTDALEDYGLIVTEKENMYEMVKKGDRIGAQLIVHAIGDRANHMILNIYEKVMDENGERDRRFRIEHAQHLIPEDIPRFDELNVIPSMQPYHCIDDGRWAEPLIGKNRMQTTHAYHSLLDNNAHLIFGSDWYVAPPSPLKGIYAAVTRATLDGKNPSGWVPDQKISVEEALQAYTISPAFASFDEDIKGSLEPGKLADLVILNQDITQIDPENIWDVKVVKTIVGGEVVWAF
ncbi:MAG TPA: amidohydrolase [bacterium]|nr:amidohydrolase [bacterium]